jgi:hypothetical protein
MSDDPDDELKAAAADEAAAQEQQIHEGRGSAMHQAGWDLGIRWGIESATEKELERLVSLIGKEWTTYRVDTSDTLHTALRGPESRGVAVTYGWTFPALDPIILGNDPFTWGIIRAAESASWERSEDAPTD